MEIVVFAPHPDDDVLGCGGSIIKSKANVTAVYMTSGDAGSLTIPKEELSVIRRAEARAAADAAAAAQASQAGLSPRGHLPPLLGGHPRPRGVQGLARPLPEVPEDDRLLRARVTCGCPASFHENADIDQSDCAVVTGDDKPAHAPASSFAEGQMSLRTHAAWSGLRAVQTCWPWQ